jgi:hypothetical protein
MDWKVISLRKFKAAQTLKVLTLKVSSWVNNKYDIVKKKIKFLVEYSMAGM